MALFAKTWGGQHNEFEGTKRGQLKNHPVDHGVAAGLSICSKA